MPPLQSHETLSRVFISALWLLLFLWLGLVKVWFAIISFTSSRLLRWQHKIEMFFSFYCIFSCLVWTLLSSSHSSSSSFSSWFWTENEMSRHMLFSFIPLNWITQIGAAAVTGKKKTPISQLFSCYKWESVLIAHAVSLAVVIASKPLNHKMFLIILLFYFILFYFTTIKYVF